MDTVCDLVLMDETMESTWVGRACIRSEKTRVSEKTMQDQIPSRTIQSEYIMINNDRRKWAGNVPKWSEIAAPAFYNSRKIARISLV